MTAVNLATVAAASLKTSFTGNERLGVGDPATGDTAAGTVSTLLAPVTASVVVVQAVANAALPKSGGTMTGPVVLSGLATLALHPATKGQLDTAIAGVSSGGAAVPAVYATLRGITFDGTTDDTAAWTTLFNAVPVGTTIICPAATTKITTLTIPSGITLQGSPCYSYVGNPIGGTIFRSASAAAILSPNEGCGLFGIAVWGPGSGTASTGVYGGAGGFTTMNNCNIYACGTGVDCGYEQFFLQECSVHECGTGLLNPVDSRILNSVFNANTGPGIYLNSGSNDNTIIGNKLEWNAQNNIFMYATANNTFSGNTLDRSGGANISMVGCYNANVIGNIVRRSGRFASGTTDQDAHFYLEGNTNCNISDNNTYIGADDNGSGYNSPAYSIAGKTNTNLIISGNIFNSVVAPIGMSITPGWQLLGNIGLGDSVSTGIGISALRSGKSSLTATGGATPTGTFTYTDRALTANSVGRWYEMTVFCRDASTATRYAATVNIFVGIETTATVQVAVTNQLGTLFGLTGGSTTVRFGATVVANGSAFTLTWTNTGANPLQLEWLLQRFGNWSV